MEVKLRKLTEDDYEIVEPWFNSERIAPYLKSIYRLKKYNRLIHQLSINERSNALFLGLQNSLPIGFVGLSFIDRIDKTATIWYLIGDNKKCGQGLATELVNSAVAKAFNTYKLQSINASVVVSNPASMRVLEKNNFKRVGVQRQCHVIDGKYWDRIFFDLVRGDSRVAMP